MNFNRLLAINKKPTWLLFFLNTINRPNKIDPAKTKVSCITQKKLVLSKGNFKIKQNGKMNVIKLHAKLARKRMPIFSFKSRLSVLIASE
jgi:hypothetical protein